ncbi:MAG: hypothetical protein QGF21_03860 [Vicinamibacterales bacterium]|nr:hypothetical protein [Acidobacteriota bacterium]MDP7671065.1 hypothetical protein [Vicinamibacterales bacterium]
MNRFRATLVGALAVLCVGLAAPAVAAQDAPAAAIDQAAPAESGVDALRVYLDCDFRCDFDFLRQEITFVNYVRDRRDAQVHVLVTRQRTAAGGQAYTFDFIGLEEFTGQDDQQMFFSTPDDTDDSERHGFAQIFQLGLMRYAARTPLAGRIQISHEDPSGGRQQLGAQPEDDPWNFWVFRARLNTRVEGEDLETSKTFGGSLSANRTTDDWKINIGANVDYDEDTFELSDGRTLNDVSRRNSATSRFIKTLGEHMGLGFGGSANTSTFRNIDVAWRVSPAFQFNLFPYSESTRRELTLTYAVGYNDYKYFEETIFGKLEETRVDHSMRVSLDTNQPWGDAGVSYEFSQFLDEPSQSRQVLFGNVEYRLFRGFFLNIFGTFSRVRDQIYLARGGVTDEEILLRRRDLATDSEYNFRIGFTYAFGSIYNNVVNSRFDGAAGGFIRTF